MLKIAASTVAHRRAQSGPWLGIRRWRYPDLGSRTEGLSLLETRALVPVQVGVSLFFPSADSVASNPPGITGEVAEFEVARILSLDLVWTKFRRSVSGRRLASHSPRLFDRVSSCLIERIRRPGTNRM